MRVRTREVYSLRALIRRLEGLNEEGGLGELNLTEVVNLEIVDDCLCLELAAPTDELVPNKYSRIVAAQLGVEA